jgi:hypothetical protein
MKAMLDDDQLDGLLDSLQEMSRLMDANLQRQSDMMVMIAAMVERIERLEAQIQKQHRMPLRRYLDS